MNEKPTPTTINPADKTEAKVTTKRTMLEKIWALVDEFCSYIISPEEKIR